MNPRANQERLAQAAFWYYVQDLSQNEVAERLGTSRSNVSRLLRAARERGIIRFQVAYPTRRDLQLELSLLERFKAHGVREVIVATPTTNDKPTGESGTLSAARVASEWLDANVKDGLVIGMFWGGTVRSMVDVAHFSSVRDVHVVQLAGEWSNDPRRSGHDLVRDLALKIGGRYTYFNAPAFTVSAAEAEALFSDPQVAASINLAQSTNLSVLGIGNFNAGTTEIFLEQANATDEEIQEAIDKKVVGQIAGRFFDTEGQQVPLEIHQRLVSLELADVREADTIVAVAAGAAKYRAVRGALHGRLIDVLICDSTLAKALHDNPN